MPELCTIYDYMRAHAALLGERILQEYPALHQFDDPVSPRIEHLLRKPFPAQTIAIMGTAKRWQRARTAMVVGRVRGRSVQHLVPARSREDENTRIRMGHYRKEFVHPGLWRS